MKGAQRDSWIEMRTISVPFGRLDQERSVVRRIIRPPLPRRIIGVGVVVGSADWAEARAVVGINVVVTVELGGWKSG